MRRLWALVAVVGLLAIFGWGDLGEMVSKWTSGPLGSTTQWGPFTLFWWGRLGKCLQFLGGLVALLDLVDPEKVREAARKASARARKLRRTLHLSSYLSELIALENLLLSRTVWHNPTDWRGLEADYIDPTPPRQGFAGSLVPLEDYLRMKDDFVKNRHDYCGRQCRYGEPHEWICSDQKVRLKRAIRDLVTSGLPAEERPVRELAEEEVAALNLAEPLLSLAVLGAGIGIFTWGVAEFSHSAMWAAMGLFGSASLAFTVMTSGELMLEKSGVWLRYKPAIFLRLRFARALEVMRPSRKLRWAGFAIFFVGFHLDLLAS
ncbi:hypothetical protein [Nonomuraea sp. NPDC001023]|uniref:hypothetical protein n=1 Tax=unclassified Nonomuraea TaxID=2593643 RepID=UPI0033276AB7